MNRNPTKPADQEVPEFVAALRDAAYDYLRRPTAGQRALFLTAVNDYLTSIEEGFPAEWRVLKALEQAWIHAEHDMCYLELGSWTGHPEQLEEALFGIFRSTPAAGKTGS